MSRSSFSGKTILITGAAGGFGQELVKQLGALGARLVLGDINVDALGEMAKASSCELRWQSCDVTNEQDQTALVEAALDAFGGLDIAINNAGIAPKMKSFVETTEAEMDQQFAINTKGVFLGMKSQIPVMLERGGSILNVASVAGLNGAPKLASYVAAKHAVVGLTKTAAVEYARKNIRINAICPFYSLTPMVTAGPDADKQEFLVNAVPMKRLATPEEIVDAMLGILSQNNSYMTGQAIAIDGGVTAL